MREENAYGKTKTKRNSEICYIVEFYFVNIRINEIGLKGWD